LTGHPGRPRGCPLLMAAMVGLFYEPMNKAFWRAVTAEFLAMFLFVFVCVGCALSTLNIASGASPLATYNATLSISLCFGLTIFVLAHCFGHISGAHINPAVTLALVVARQITLLRGALYALAQFLGSIVASGVLMAVMGLKADTMGGYNALSGPDDNKVARGLLTEFILTFLLCFTVFATIDPKRKASENLGPLAIGMAVGVAHLIAVPITGCGINPARSLGPALFASADAAKEDLWVFLLAPLFGGVVAAVLYPFWFAEVNFTGGLRGKFTSDDVMELAPGEGIA